MISSYQDLSNALSRNHYRFKPCHLQYVSSLTDFIRLANRSQAFAYEAIGYPKITLFIRTLGDCKILFKAQPLLAKHLAGNNSRVLNLLTLDYLLELHNNYHFAANPTFHPLWKNITTIKNFPNIAAVSLELALQIKALPGIADYKIPVETLLMKNMVSESKITAFSSLTIKTKITDIQDKNAGTLMTSNKAQQTVDLIKKRFLSLHDYIDHMMFGTSGYYSQGRVKFSGPDFHYTTCASQSNVVPAFSAAIAFQLLQSWQVWRKTPDYKHADKTFNVLECGAGDGDLCYHIFTTIQYMIKYADSLNPVYWQLLQLDLRYYIIERSAVLRERQKKRNQDFLSKIIFIQADARHLAQALAGTTIAVTFSNELVDVFALHKLTRLPDETLGVGMVAPKISYDNLQEMLKKLSLLNQKINPEVEFKKYSAQSKLQKTLLNMLFTDFPHLYAKNTKTKAGHEELYQQCMASPEEKLEQTMILLSASDFLDLHAHCADTSLIEAFEFSEFDLNLDYFPTIKKFLQTNPEYVSHIATAEARYANTNIATYLDEVYQVLDHHGLIYIIDYGGNDIQCKNSFRTYPPGLGNDIFLQPGKIDITSDVNFTTIVDTWTKYYGSLVFFGNQRALLPVELFKKAGYSEQMLKNFCEQYQDFQVCVLEKNHENFYTNKLRFFSDRTNVSTLELKRNYIKEVNNFKLKYV